MLWWCWWRSLVHTTRLYPLQLSTLAALLLLLPPHGAECQQLTANVTGFDPPDTGDDTSPLFEGDSLLVRFNYTIVSGATAGHPVPDTLCSFTIVSADPDVATVSYPSSPWQPALLGCNPGDGGTGNFTVSGVFIGHTRVIISLLTAPGGVRYTGEVNPRGTNNTREDVPGEVIEAASYAVSVSRRVRPVDAIFNVVITTFVALNTAAFGCTLQLEVVREVLRRPVAPGIGALGQFVIMPLIAYSLTQALTLADYLQLGLFTMGCTPGGGASNMWTLLLDGDISLSITMTFISTCLALVTMPLWLLTLGTSLMADSGRDIHIPYVDIVQSLALLIGPLIVGVLLKRYRERWAKKVARVIKPVCILLILFSLTVGVYSNLYIFYLLTPTILLVACTLPWLGFLLAGLLAWACRLPWSRVKTVAIETGVQNTNLALVLLRSSLPAPDGDLSSSIPIAINTMTPVPLLLMFVTRLCYKWRRARGGGGKGLYEEFTNVDDAGAGGEGNGHSEGDTHVNTPARAESIEICQLPVMEESVEVVDSRTTSVPSVPPHGSSVESREPPKMSPSSPPAAPPPPTAASLSSECSHLLTTSSTGHSGGESGQPSYGTHSHTSDYTSQSLT